MNRLVLCLALGVCLVLPVAASGGGAPPGATARCRDGTYSFSQHHQGTCSHHGGVAAWLDGSSSASARKRGSEPSPSTTGTVSVGMTIPLGRRTRTAGCTLGPRPDRRCSPGAIYSKLTRAVICSPSFRTSSIRNVPESVRFAVEREYGMTPGHYGSALEIDHIVSLELGGSNDVANLFPETLNARPGYRVKDRLENRLHAMVCAGSIGLRAAQRGIAANWHGLYERVFGAAPA
jgi:Protein of unknown function (DUF3761)